MGRVKKEDTLDMQGFDSRLYVFCVRVCCAPALRIVYK